MRLLYRDMRYVVLNWMICQQLIKKISSNNNNMWFILINSLIINTNIMIFLMWRL